MKALTPKDTKERNALSDGVIAWRLRGSMRGPFFDVAGDDGASSSSSVAEQSFVFWHVATMNFSPYQPVFQPMECQSTADGGDLPEEEEEELAVTAISCVGRFPDNAPRTCHQSLGYHSRSGGGGIQSNARSNGRTPGTTIQS